jgi:hypothetical protein
MNAQLKTCSNADCRFATDGKCVEGYPLSECPHLSQFSVEDIQEAEEPKVVREPVRLVSLSLGDALNRAQASSLQRRRLSRLVGIIGPNDSGKTSLLASIYDLLQEGPVANVGFAGSSTLVGFEKVCHDARAASRRDTPHMERTSAGADAVFFHLDLRLANGGLVALFIGDRSGEDYLAAADALSRADEFFELRRADVVTLLVNGEHLASSEYRHEAKAVSQQVVDALVEAGSFRLGCKLAIVLTKQDYVLESSHAERVKRDFDGIADSLSERHSHYFSDIERFIVAASPKDITKLKRGDGVDRLLQFWLLPDAPPPSVYTKNVESTRMIDLLDNNREAFV